MLQFKRGGWIVIGWLTAMGLAQAAMYKWVDENGVTQYTQYPPPDRKVEVMVPPPPPAEDPDAAQKKLETLLQSQDDQRKTAATTADEQAKAAEQQQIREKNCQTARSNLAKLTTGGRKRIVGADGIATYLSDEDRQASIDLAQKQIEEFCN